MRLEKQRPCIQSIINCYDIRVDSNICFYNYPIASSQDITLEKKTHRLILTARPDEFEKLPPKCNACGTILQTENATLSGYVPEEKFISSVQENMLDKLMCYGCFQLRFYNKSVAPRLNTEDVLSQLRHLRQRKALILYVVDMFDVEGTMFSNILQVIGKRKRLIIVGNKVDRLPQDEKKPVLQLEHMKDVLKETCYRNGLENCNFRDICLISAKSGYGIQNLVEKINKHRDVDMDVYLVGCANTGKSTLYNSLVNLLNVHKTTGLPSQAIEHHLPGTTNSLVREGISMRRLKRMEKRLTSSPWEVDEEYQFDDDVLELVGHKTELPQKKNKERKNILTDETKSIQKRALEFVDPEVVREKPCYIYDTPGIMNESQIIQYLTPDEINYLCPERWIVPRTVLMNPGNCIFIGGIARFDFNEITRGKLGQHGDEEDNSLVPSAESIFVTVMTSPNLPIHVTITETADEKYEKLFVNDILRLPQGSTERFEEFPSLLPQEYTIVGNGLNKNACDIVLHGVGWLSIASVVQSKAKFVLRTPNGKGQSLREKPLLPYSVRKKAGRGVVYRGYVNNRMYGHSRKSSPQFVRVFQTQNDAVYSWKMKVKQKLKTEKYALKEEKRLKRLERGVILGKMKQLANKEKQFKDLEDKEYLQLQEKPL